MGIVISIYSKASFKEFILPSVNNSDYQITLRKDDFQIQEDLILDLEVLNDQWFLKRGFHYFLIRDNVACERHVLHNADVYMIRSVSQDELSLIVKEVDSSFHAYKKYILRAGAKITVGKDAKNTICYDHLGLVSRRHAVLNVTDNGLSIENKSPNGTYADAKRIDGAAEIGFGAYINIMGLHMVYLGDLLAVDAGNGVAIDESKLIPYQEEEDATVYLRSGHEDGGGDEIYHRAPRNYERLEEDTIEIEAPPQKSQTGRQSLLMSVGPSVTMALPMLLGCLLMMQSSGEGGLYMYSGLIMSVGSAAVGVVWTLANMRYQKIREKEMEDYRFQEYSSYLVERTEEVKEKYEDTAMRLQETYPSAQECLMYDRDKGALWNRNYTHEDFLVHRIGTGSRPFQCHIEIPKKQFSLYKDELADKPAYVLENYKTLYDVPVTVDLLKEKLVGIVGSNKKKAAEIVRLLSIQLSANNCYTDVKMGYVYVRSSSADHGQFDFAKWFPHVWSEDHGFRYVADSREEAGEVLYELVKIFRAREEEGGIRKGELPKPYYVAFISDVSLLQGELFAKYALSKDERYGLTTVILAEHIEDLPNECEFVIENTDRFTGMYEVSEGKTTRQKVAFDRSDGEDLEKFARKLTSLHVSEVEDGGEIPNSITFFEMLGVNRIEEYPVAERWAKSRTYENIRGQLGQRAGGTPCYLDVHEKYHGPHGLVAGTTGSGKSETLQTYILSLAVNYSPDDIGFFIIDYKGGGMANLFAGLPHMVGSISNLSGNQVKRAMTSIKSENRRRQRVFTEHGVNNINLYTKLYKNGEANMPIPHLFIIIDEFAEMKREEPDFMHELISVAQVGRSLGVHLILATQKPGGTVDDNIWSNSKFRICLRVQDQQDSKDMLHKPDAAYITQAGRGYLQVGSDEVYELFQSGFSGAVYDENMANVSRDIAKLVTISGKVDMTGNSVRLSQKMKVEELWISRLIHFLQDILQSQRDRIYGLEDAEKRMSYLVEEMYQRIGKENIDYPENEYNIACMRNFISLYVTLSQEEGGSPLPGAVIQMAVEKHRKLPQAREHTQLDVTKEYLASVAQENGYTHKIQLWMPLLGKEIYLSEFEEYEQSCFSRHGWLDYHESGHLDIVIGKMDDPENQNQMPLIVDLMEQGHIAVIGNIVSGKSTMLQTMAYALIQKFSPDRINIYAIDFSSKMMMFLEQAPHVGGVMYENDNEKIGKFFNVLQKIIDERKALFKGGDYKQYIQRNGAVLPAIVLFVDNYASFKEKTQEEYEPQMIQISREGVSLGIYLIVTGAGYGYADITNRVGENIETVLCLALQDKYAYGDMLHNMKIDITPEIGVPGRGLAYYGTRVLEYQTALPVEAPNNYMRMEKMEESCRQMKEAWKGRPARKIPEIPAKPTWSLFADAEGFQAALADPGKVPVGYDIENADVYAVSLREIYCYLVTGTPRSGKTNFMKLFVRSVLEKGSEVAVFDPPRGSLRQFNGDGRITYVSDDKGIFDYFGNVLTPVFQSRNKRKNEMLNEDYEENEIFDEMSKEPPYFIFISDLKWFVDLIYASQLEMKGFMETLAAKGRYHHIYFIAEMALSQISAVRGYLVFDSFAGYKTGIHFGGKSSSDTLLSFEHLSYMEQDQTDKPGIGTLSDMNNDGHVKKVVIPFARK